MLPRIKQVAAGRDDGKVVLLRIVEPLPAGKPPAVDFEVVRKAGTKAAEDYFARTQDKLSREGLSVETKVLTGRPAETIGEFAQREKMDLVAIATHANSGIRRWAFGSVPDKLVTSSAVPILLIRPRGFESRV